MSIEHLNSMLSKVRQFFVVVVVVVVENCCFICGVKKGNFGLRL